MRKKSLILSFSLVAIAITTTILFFIINLQLYSIARLNWTWGMEQQFRNALSPVILTTVILTLETFCLLIPISIILLITELSNRESLFFTIAAATISGFGIILIIQSGYMALIMSSFFNNPPFSFSMGFTFGWFDGLWLASAGFVAGLGLVLLSTIYASLQSEKLQEKLLEWFTGKNKLNSPDAWRKMGGAWRKIGGILAIFGGGLIFIALLFSSPSYVFLTSNLHILYLFLIGLLWDLLFALLALIGGILSLRPEKIVGNALALIGGIFLGLLPGFHPNYLFDYARQLGIPITLPITLAYLIPLMNLVTFIGITLAIIGGIFAISGGIIRRVLKKEDMKEMSDKESERAESRRKVGGTLAIIGGVLNILVYTLWLPLVNVFTMPAYMLPYMVPGILILFGFWLVIFVGIVGGFLLRRDKAIGAILALIGGSIGILFGMLYVFPNMWLLIIGGSLAIGGGLVAIIGGVFKKEDLKESGNNENGRAGE